MDVPFIDLKRITEPLHEEIIASWGDVLKNTQFVGGDRVTALEKDLSAKLDAPGFVACANGTDALIIGLQAIGVKPGDRVALPNMTFWAPFEAVVQIGAEPVLIDIDPEDLQMCFDEFKLAHEQFRFSNAIFVHLFGWTSARLFEFRRFCKENDIKLLEDCAQGFGVKHEGQSIFREAEIGTTSFYPAKVFGGCADGGAITTANPKLAEYIRALANHGRAGHYTYDYVGWNSRMSGLQGAYLNHMLQHIDEFLESRRRAESFYQEFFAPHADLVKCYKGPAATETNGYLSVFTSPVKSGPELASYLQKRGIGCGRTYPQTIDMQPPAQKALRSSSLKVSKEFCERVINLPLFAGITMEECEASAQCLLEGLKA